MANGNDFKGGGSPWGSPPRGGNGSGRGGRRPPPNIDEVIDDFKNDTNIFCYVDAISGKVIADYTKNGGTKIEY